jgi:hypothetical protein
MPGLVRWRRCARFATIALSTTALASCSLVDPYVTPNKDIRQKYNDERSLEAAFKYAEALRDEYKGAISDQAILNNSVGLALIPVAALAAYYGITGGHSNTVLGLGLGGAGAYIGASYLHNEPRQFVYASGVTAVNCAISIMEPMRRAQIVLEAENTPEAEGTAQGDEKVAKNASLTPRITRLELATSELKVAIGGALQFLNSQDPAIIVAQDTVNAATATAADGRAVEVLLKTSGGTLFSSVRQIEATVDRAVIDTEPNLSALVSSLGTSLPLRAGQIAPQPKPTEKVQGQAGQGQPGAFDVDSVTQSLTDKRQAVEREIIAVREIVDMVKDRTPEQSLQNCGVDISKSGLTFKLIPEAPIAFIDAGAKEASTISVRGGEPPYAATWVGATPPDITATLTPSPSWDETGVLTVTETTESPAPGTYSLLVHDAGVGETIIEVRSQNAGQPASANVRTGAAPARALAPDPDVQQLQLLLEQKDIDPGKIDGRFGPDTLTAIRTFKNDQSLTEAQARQMVPALIRELGGTPISERQPVTNVPVVAPPPLTAEEQAFVDKAIPLLSERRCLANPDVPANPVEARQKVSAGVSNLLAEHQDLNQLGSEQAVEKLEQDPGLSCAAQ